MDEEKKKRKKKPAESGDGGHKKPWQETCATPEEIKAMLSERVMLRYNEVRGRTVVGKCGSGDVFLNPSRTACVYAVREATEILSPLPHYHTKNNT